MSGIGRGPDPGGAGHPAEPFNTLLRASDHATLDKPGAAPRPESEADDQWRQAPDEWRLPIDRSIAIVSIMGLATMVIFVLGIGNFALNRAVFESGHPLLERLPRISRMLGNRAALVSEFAMLFFALLLSVNGWPGIVWAYGGYTAFNAIAAWLFLSGRV